MRCERSHKLAYFPSNHVNTPPNLIIVQLRIQAKLIGMYLNSRAILCIPSLHTEMNQTSRLARGSHKTIQFFMHVSRITQHLTDLLNPMSVTLSTFALQRMKKVVSFSECNLLRCLSLDGTMFYKKLCA